MSAPCPRSLMDQHVPASSTTICSTELYRRERSTGGNGEAARTASHCTQSSAVFQAVTLATQEGSPDSLPTWRKQKPGCTRIRSVNALMRASASSSASGKRRCLMMTILTMTTPLGGSHRSSADRRPSRPLFALRLHAGRLPFEQPFLMHGCNVWPTTNDRPLLQRFPPDTSDR